MEAHENIAVSQDDTQAHDAEPISIRRLDKLETTHTSNSQGQLRRRPGRQDEEDR